MRVGYSEGGGAWGGEGVWGNVLTSNSQLVGCSTDVINVYMNL